MTEEPIVLQENLYPKDEFHSVLNKIANHRFVTEYSKELRKKGTDWLNSIKGDAEKVGMKKCIFIPSGSVAVGMSLEVENSDLDGSFVFESNVEDSENWQKFTNEVELPNEIEQVSFSNIRNNIEHANNYDYSNLIQKLTSDETVDPDDLRYVAKIFAPSLNEFRDNNEQKIMDDWRKKVISDLSLLPINDGIKIWDLMRTHLKKQYINYENSFGGDTEKRKERVELVLDSQLELIYKDDSKRKKLARSVIDIDRQKLEYPDFEKMKELFL